MGLKHSFIALTFGLAASLAGTSAFANTGTINFEGAITGGTCPIEIVNPGDGSIGGLVRMVSVDASSFTGVDQEYGGKGFSLRIKDGAECGVAVGGGKGTVTFNGTADGADYFAVRTTSDAAKGVAIAIRDSSGNAIGPGVASVEYPIAETGPSEMRFDAYYHSTQASVTKGVASADISFLVTII